MREVSDCITCDRFYECKFRGVVHGCVNYKEIFNEHNRGEEGYRSGSQQ